MMNNFNFLKYEENEDRSLEHWDSSQFDLVDVVLYLTDNGSKFGIKIYALFRRKEIQDLLHFYCCDFKKMKEILGIDEYVARKGDIYSKKFNPIRNYYFQVPFDDVNMCGERIYFGLISDLKKIARRLNID